MRRPSKGRSGWMSAGLATLVVAGALLAVLVSSAGASPTLAGSSRATTCTSTYPFSGNTDPTVPCTTSTTAPTYVPRLTVSYQPDGHRVGTVRWQACGYPPSAAGQTVSFEVDGVVVGPTGRLGVGGCTSDPAYTACLRQGTYDAVDVVQGYQSASAGLTIDSTDACDTAASVAPPASSPPAAATTTSSQGGTPLAFTGTDALLAVAVGLLAIASGLVLLRGSRRRHSTAP